MKCKVLKRQIIQRLNVSVNFFSRKGIAIIISFSFFFCIAFSTNAQEFSNRKLPQISLNKRMNESNTASTIGWDDFINNPPIQFGLEAGTSFLRKRDYCYLSTCFIGSIDINLYNKVVFLRLEAGKLFYNKKDFTRVSLGPNFKIYKTGKSRFFLSTNASFDVRTGGIIGTLEVSSRYVYLISKVFGISTSIRYPFWNTDSSGRGDPIIGIGIQLFTK